MPAKSTGGSTDPEGAVRLYLMFLEDPNKLVDKGNIANLEGRLDTANDPIEKLKLITALERAKVTDGSAFEKDFISTAKSWADESGIPVSAFQELGVSDSVLNAAGFNVGTGRGRRGAAAASRRTSKPRAKSVTGEQIRAWVMSQGEPVTVSAISSGVGGSAATIKKVIDSLKASGELVDRGPVPGHRGKGRAPTQYARS